jgi:membrane protein implicated in regulation of membrane protease activity
MLLILALVGLFVLPEPWNVVAVVAAAFVEVGEVFFWLRFLRRYRIRTGAEAMVGRHAEVLEGSSHAGRVRLSGEIWNARSEVPVTKGQIVRITAVDGLTLVIEPVVDRWRAARGHGKGPGEGAPAP